jgi:hypothetical protein
MARRPDSIATEPARSASLYVNHFAVAHNQYEFLIDLGQFRPSQEDVEGTLSVHTSLALSPPYAKMLSQLLARAVDEHEEGHGCIAVVSEPATPFDIVLHSLPEFEERARELRERAVRNANEAAKAGNDPGARQSRNER